MLIEQDDKALAERETRESNLALMKAALAPAAAQDLTHFGSLQKRAVPRADVVPLRKVQPPARPGGPPSSPPKPGKALPLPAAASANERVKVLLANLPADTIKGLIGNLKRGEPLGTGNKRANSGDLRKLATGSTNKLESSSMTKIAMPEMNKLHRRL